MSPDALSVAAPDISIELEAQQSDLPVGWAWAQLGEIVIHRNEKVQPDRSSALPFIGMDDVPPGSLRATSHGWFRDMKSAANAVGPGEILYGRLRPYLNKVALAEASAAVSGEFIVLQPRASIAARYAQFALHSRKFVNFATRGTSGERPRIDFDKISKFNVPIPPVAEQRRIVARIDELFAEIAEGEAALNGARQGLDTWRRALLKAAVTGELTRDWREANRPAETGADLLERILHRRRADWEKRQACKRSEMGRLTARYPAPDAPSAPASWELPKTWAWASSDQITRGDRPSSYGVLQPGVDVPGGIPLVRVGDIHDGRVEVRGLKRIASAIAAEYSRTQLSGGELLITLVGAIGRTAVVPPELSGANTARAVGVIPLSGPVNAAWVELWFRSPSKQIEMVGKAHEVARKDTQFRRCSRRRYRYPSQSGTG
jgi:type I restriction enzyme S subunit